MNLLNERLKALAAVTHRQDIECIEWGLRALFDIRRVVSSTQPNALDGSIGDLQETMLAITDEVHELGREITCFKWKTDPPTRDRKKIIEEYIDVLAFVAKMGLIVQSITDCTESELAEVCIRKAKVSVKKLTERYPINRVTPTDDQIQKYVFDNWDELLNKLSGQNIK